jgi:hypothetical protein
MRRFLLFLGVLCSLNEAVLAAETKPAAKNSDRFHWSDLLPRAFQKNPRLNLSILTELTAEGKKAPVASAEHPVYYSLIDGGYAEGGDAIAGEKPPKAETLSVLLKNALASGGFKPATEGNPSTVVVYYRWGTYNHIAPMDPAAADETGEGSDTIDTTDPIQMRNLSLRAALVGGPKFAKEMMDALMSHHFDYFQEKNARTSTLVAMALRDLYFVIAVGYDAKAAAEGKKVMLWITRISTDNSGLAMDDTLPALVTSARDYIGHETNGPVLFHPRLYPGKVEIGEAEVKGIAAPGSPGTKPEKE